MANEQSSPTSSPVLTSPSDWHAFLHKAIGTAISASGVASAIFTWFVVYLTIPIAGMTFHHCEPPPDGQSKGGSTIRQYEVFNPGPGNIYDVAIVIDVHERFDEVAKTFSGGLVVTAHPTSKMVHSANGHQGKITVTPAHNNSTPILNDGNRFGVILKSPDSAWTPFDVNMLYGGKLTPVSAGMTSASPRLQAFLVLAVGPFLLILSGIAYYWLAWKMMEKSTAWAKEEAERQKQSIQAQAYADATKTLSQAAVVPQASTEYSKAIENAPDQGRKLILPPGH